VQVKRNKLLVWFHKFIYLLQRCGFLKASSDKLTMP